MLQRYKEIFYGLLFGLGASLFWAGCSGGRGSPATLKVSPATFRRRTGPLRILRKHVNWQESGAGCGWC
jgi:hypothetical protein